MPVIIVIGSEPSLSAVVAWINIQHLTCFALSGRFAQGEQGAYRLVDDTGDHFVLKWQRGATAATSLATLAATLDRLRNAGYPAPRLVLFGVHPHDPVGCYAVQEALPGTPLTSVDEGIVEQILALNDLQVGLSAGSASEAGCAKFARSAEPWPALPIGDVLRGGNGYCLLEPMQAHSQQTAALLKALQEYVAVHQLLQVPQHDLVHFDLNPANILAKDGRVTGVVDWDGACAGDRAFDLCTLLFYGYDVPAHSRGGGGIPRGTVGAGVRLWERVCELVGADAAGVYLAHMAHRQVDWMVRYHPMSVKRWLRTTEAVLSDVVKRTGWPSEHLLSWAR